MTKAKKFGPRFGPRGRPVEDRKLAYAIQCAQLNKPVTRKEMAETLNLNPRNVDNFVYGCRRIPWMKVETVDGGYIFSIDSTLKQMIEWYQVSKLKDSMPIEFLEKLVLFWEEGVRRLRQDLQQRMDERSMNIKAKGWTHDSLNKFELLRTIQWIDQQLQQLLLEARQPPDSHTAGLDNLHTPTVAAKAIAG